MPGPDIGANRYRNQPGIVTEAINPGSGIGRVRVENEEWRATSSRPLDVGTRVRVTEVSGTRFVVEED